MSPDVWFVWVPAMPWLSVMIWLLLAVTILYIARRPARQALRALFGSVHNLLRLLARALMLMDRRLQQRNHEVLLAQGRLACERTIEREFLRVEKIVARDLGGYPSLQRDLREQIMRIDEDYVKSADVPPQPPEWLHAIEAVAQIPSNGSPVVAKILNDIHITLKKSMEKSLNEYRRASRERHLMLGKMMPYWRSLTNILQSVEKKIGGLETRSVTIDNQMAMYEQILQKTDYASRVLTASSLTSFLVSAIVLSIAVIGGFVNFQLVALPLSEMVGARSQLLGMPAADIAALFVISLEVILGVFLMEAAGVTRLFPVISMLEDRKRHMIIWLTLAFLLVLACVEASLAYMRDALAADNAALRAMLSDTVKTDDSGLSWIPSVGQMVLGFILPFALTFVAIAFESFVHALRTVAGLLLGGVLHVLAFVIRLLALLIQGVGRMVLASYDLIIFLPLNIERMVSAKTSVAASTPEA
jgi:hypothetical protein